MNPVRLERETFSTSRLLDFVSEKELTMQCGHGPDAWPLVVVKELIDNALDGCEEQGIAPEITVTVDESEHHRRRQRRWDPAGRRRSSARLLDPGLVHGRRT